MRALCSAAALLASAVLVACGGTDEAPSLAVSSASGEAATLAWAIAESPETFDPLYASTVSEQLVSRQIHEPLVEELSAPFGATRRLGGLARSLVGVRGDTVWLVRLRPGIRFQDGTPLTSQAVLANVARWQAFDFPVGTGLVPGTLVDGPRPDLVRFRLPQPDPGFPDALAAPELGIVAPRALARAAGEPLSSADAATSGTGAFELRERAAGRLLLARNSDWWGSEKGLGPGLDLLEFLVGDPAGERVEMLVDGEVQVAGELGPVSLELVASDPLLTEIEGSGLGAERSVRGIPLRELAPSLNGVWRTSL